MAFLVFDNAKLWEDKKYPCHGRAVNDRGKGFTVEFTAYRVGEVIDRDIGFIGHQCIGYHSNTWHMEKFLWIPDPRTTSKTIRELLQDEPDN